MRKNGILLAGVAILILMVSSAATTIHAADNFNAPGPVPEHGVYDPGKKSEMDDLAGSREIADFVERLKTDWNVFVEDRENSIRLARGLPKRWLGDLTGHTQTFKGNPQPGEFYVFQLGLFAAKRAVGEIGLTFGDLTGENGAIGRAQLHCFNLGGVDHRGAPFTKKISVPKGNVQPLWIGVDVPADAKGVYRGTIKVRDLAGGGEANVAVQLNVAGEALTDHGDRDSWRLSRLRWLDSTIGLDDDSVTAPYLPIQRDGNNLKILGRDMTIGQDGLPRQFRSRFNAGNTAVIDGDGTPILASPFRLVVVTDWGEMPLQTGKVDFIRQQAGAVEWRTTLTGDGLTADITGSIEYEGFVRYRCDLRSSRPVKVQDIRLEFAVRDECAKYFMGLGRRGGYRPTDAIDWKWNPKVNQDGFWMGAVNAGFKLQLKGHNFRSPLINCYYGYRPLNVPESWGGADGLGGGFRVVPTGDGSVLVRAFSGPREMQAGDSLGYDFDLFLTPFKLLATEEQWAMRYYHPGGGGAADLRDPSRIKAMGANLLNIHQSREQNPTINYPYFDLSMPLLKTCVADAHKNGIKAKIYYTTREITNNLPELFVFWSMNGEIICPGPGKDAKPLTNPNGPHPWLLERLGGTGYIPAWRDTLGGRYKGMLDLAVLTTPDSRLDNFYLEGLAFTLRETGIDGIYVDDTALDRKAFQRAHRIFEKAGKRFLADMHSWSHFNPHAGMTPSAYCYMQGFPYYHRLWYGEGFGYDTPPDYWLVEMSGIPFGLMGEMLEGGGNPWRGMVFGMTGRLGWGGNPQPMWKFWDRFGMAGTELLGFWDSACPIKTDNPNVQATVYKKKGQAIVSLASWAKEKVDIKLEIDWNSLGIDPAKTTILAPAIEKFQPERQFKTNDAIPMTPGRGWLLVISEK